MTKDLNRQFNRIFVTGDIHGDMIGLTDKLVLRPLPHRQTRRQNRILLPIGEIDNLRSKRQMSTNISKLKREALITKIAAIRTVITKAPNDENTGNLLSYLADLEKEVKGKKYGLVFEEHRESIDEVLATHTPILTEEPDYS